MSAVEARHAGKIEIDGGCRGTGGAARLVEIGAARRGGPGTGDPRPAPGQALLTLEGRRAGEIAAVLGVHVSTVRNGRGYFAPGGVAGLRQRRAPGRQVAIGPHAGAIATAILNEDMRPKADSGCGAKKTLRASQRNRADLQAKRAVFREQVRRIDAQALVFLDESGITTAMTRRYARAPGGAASGHGVRPRAASGGSLSWGRSPVTV